MLRSILPFPVESPRTWSLISSVWSRISSKEWSLKNYCFTFAVFSRIRILWNISRVNLWKCLRASLTISCLSTLSCTVFWEYWRAKKSRYLVSERLSWIRLPTSSRSIWGLPSSSHFYRINIFTSILVNNLQNTGLNAHNFHNWPLLSVSCQPQSAANGCSSPKNAWREVTILMRLIFRPSSNAKYQEILPITLSWFAHCRNIVQTRCILTSTPVFKSLKDIAHSRTISLLLLSHKWWRT